MASTPVLLNIGGVAIALRFTLFHFLFDISRAPHYYCPEREKWRMGQMDKWLEEWLDNESARMREQEARKATWKRTVTRLMRTRMWTGRN